MNLKEQDQCWEVKCFMCKETLFYYYKVPKLDDIFLVDICLKLNGDTPEMEEDYLNVCGCGNTEYQPCVEDAVKIDNPFKEE